MNPPIPTRPCAFCKVITNETHSKYGVLHQNCYRYIAEKIGNAWVIQQSMKKEK
jgi:hypothetical protein